VAVLGLIYTVERVQDKFLHMVSSQLKRARSGNYHEQCMLTMIMFLERELEETGINPGDVELHFDQSD
jgi:hypothetical protein